MDKNEKDTAKLPMNSKLLNEFNNYILAQRNFKVSDVERSEYITWLKGNDGSVSLGHYFTSLDAAKEDFAKRSELIPYNKAFTDNELAVLYKALSVYEQGEQVDYDNKELCNSIESVRSKLSSLPDIDKYTKIRVLVVPVDSKPYVKDIKNELSSLQDEVNGYIECIYGFGDDDAVLVCNEMGKINNLPPNRPINGDVITGNFIVLNTNDNGEFSSLSENQIEKYTNEFSIQRDSFKRSVDKAVSDIQSDTTPDKNANIER